MPLPIELRRKPLSALSRREQELLDRTALIANWIARGDKDRKEVIRLIQVTWPIQPAAPGRNEVLLTTQAATKWFYRGLDLLRSGYFENAQEARGTYVRSLQMAADELRSLFRYESVEKTIEPGDIDPATKLPGPPRVVQTKVKMVVNGTAINGWFKIVKEIATVMGARPLPGAKTLHQTVNFNNGAPPAAAAMNAQNIEDMPPDALLKYLAGSDAEVIDAEAVSRDGDQP